MTLGSRTGARALFLGLSLTVLYGCPKGCNPFDHSDVDLRVVVSPDSATAQVGESRQFVARYDPPTLRGVMVIWQAFDGREARIDSEGIATCVKEGTAPITATIEYMGKVASDGATLTCMGNSPPPPPPPSTPPSTPPNAGPNFGGTYACVFTVQSPAPHPDDLGGSQRLEVRQQGAGNEQTVEIGSAGPSALIGVQGALRPDNTVTASGNGTYRGFPTQARMSIGFAGENRFSGQYAIGTNGSLPGGEAIIWNLSCNR